MTPLINIAKNYFYDKKYSDALEIFDKTGDFYAAGLCALLLKDEKRAKEYWQKSPLSPAASWGLALLDLINLKRPKNRPSFFQTRAQLEIYINLFIENGLIEWAQNVVSMSDILYCSNPEAYKFIARALYSNGYFDLAITFCKKSLKVFYCDPEALLILSQCYFLLGNTADALDYVNRIFDIADGYFPAVLFKNMLKAEIEKKYKK